RRVAAALLGLNAAPFQRQPQRIDAQIPCAVEILFGVVPPVARQADMVARLDASLLFPGGPLVDAATLYLVRRRRNTPEKSRREMMVRIFAGSVIHSQLGF